MFDWVTNIIIYFGAGVIVGMIAGVYMVLDDRHIRHFSNYIENIDLHEN